MRTSKGLSTAQIMKQFQVTRNALRLYEDMGLLIKIDRTDSGYRRFTEKDLEDLNFILAAKNSGVTLNEIKDFFKIARTEQSLNCATVSNELAKKIDDIDLEISTLKEKKKFLSAFLDTCGSKTSNNKCTIIQTGFEKKSCC